MHGFSTIVPFPWQRGHGWENAKRPWESETTPRPAHCGQTTGEVPGSAPGSVADGAHAVHLDGDPHLHALQRVLERDADTRLQVVAARRPTSFARRSPPPNMPPKRSLRFPRSNSSKRGPAGAAGACAGETSPARSPERVVRPSLLGIGEDVVGGLDLLELLLGPVVPGFLSGWYSRASLRYAFLMSSSDAPFGTPSTSYGLAMAASPRRSPGRGGRPCRRSVAALHDLEHRARLGVSRGCVSTASWTCGSNGPSVSISFSPSFSSAFRSDCSTSFTPSTRAASSWRSAASAPAPGRRAPAAAPGRAARGRARPGAPGRAPPACGSSRSPPSPAGGDRDTRPLGLGFRKATSGVGKSAGSTPSLGPPGSSATPPRAFSLRAGVTRSSPLPLRR